MMTIQWHFHCICGDRCCLDSMKHPGTFCLDDDDACNACVHYVMVSKFQWKPFWLATQLDPQNDWTVWQFCVNYV